MMESLVKMILGFKLNKVHPADTLRASWVFNIHLL
jgi:hypothetical protein